MPTGLRSSINSTLYCVTHLTKETADLQIQPGNVRLVPKGRPRSMKVNGGVGHDRAFSWQIQSIDTAPFYSASVLDST